MTLAALERERRCLRRNAIADVAELTPLVVHGNYADVISYADLLKARAAHNRLRVNKTAYSPGRAAQAERDRKLLEQLVNG